MTRFSSSSVINNRSADGQQQQVSVMISRLEICLARVTYVTVLTERNAAMTNQCLIYGNQNQLKSICYYVQFRTNVK